MSEKHIDEATGTATTGHVWDGIRELDTPMPRWWVWVFIATVVWAAVYVVLYPAIPGLTSNTKGTLGWSSRGDVREQFETAKAAQATFRDRIAAASFDEIIAQDDLFQFAVSAGRSAFQVNCIQCHGTGAAGGPGFPNLQDDEWIWGGTIDDIAFTITHGIRNGGDEARDALMPSFGADELLDAASIENVSAYVLSLSGGAVEKGDATAGQTVFADNCASCHGENAEGLPEMGAPALNNAVWLYGGSQAELIAQINKPRHGVMPAWGPRLGDVTVKELATYVYSLGGAAR
ncbi:MAG: cytochrome-c oxidase, cbb3-type subunit III [Rhizobiaceae bacterium]|jgi:cytochrome c oxidase cbb3-type subunit 3|nr:cytochrome-c oxidase, cbb3-type subunit III [Rhizobiaceae bacterium]